MRSLILLALLVSITTSSYGWGQTGHRVTGWIAEQHLTKKTKTHLQKLLKGQSLAIASTWMDEIRSDSAYDYTADWHWVTIPNGETYDESVKNKNGDVIQTIERLIKELKSKNISAAQEVEYIKMLIHLIGDVHQPLHVGAGNDRGGNDVKVMWFSVNSNLHRIWDTDMIDDTKLSYTELAASLENPNETQIQEWQKSSVRDWAKESMELRHQAYNYNKGRLGYEYAYQYLPTVRLRLLQAGIRLAGVLNEIYGK